MSLLLPALVSLGVGFAADASTEVARQRAAQVRTSLLTKDWTWLLQSDPATQLETLQGMLRWGLSKPGVLTIVFEVVA